MLSAAPTRIGAMRYGAFLLVGLLFAGAGGTKAATRPPIIVILTLDTTRADHLSLYGYGRPTTPALAEVARRGVVVRRAITPMPMTAPAHVSIFTGLHHGRTASA